MPLDPVVRKYLEEEYYKSNIFDSKKYTIQEIRRMFEERARKYPKEQIYKIEDRKIDSNGYEMSVRIYYPDGEKGHPIILYFHGGGWMIGSIETEDSASRILTKTCDCIVISVDYRLAPEYKFPTAVYDCFNSILWAKKNAESIGGDKDKIGLFGVSAGGNLVLTSSILAKQKGVKLSVQNAVVPVLGLDLTSKSMMEYRKGFGLDMGLPIDFMIRNYIRDEKDLLNPLFSPLLAEDLSGLPYTIIITAEYDPLRDQAEAYAYRLMESGIPTLSVRVNGMIHSFSGSPLVSRQVLVMSGALMKDLFNQ
ncbi:carboxylesterase [Sulfolobus sp. A20]|uniref:alpha/beta hydrolase n=1 Tax=Sulfolobaceae TaxID=118883 RepID=UPI000845E03E|nr:MULTISPECIES: alpha/beta hydrolase [unclassified Sulfolobus]TRM74085.1 alpha/beta hydrolase [Sulfolobus sp. E5]TRM77304.1 alpha/beta hydrolase [Sulfolobus sp. A20-N-F8]TRM89024.1 alpha/beta hydrolase [Sulfolobus sp. C3]TRN04071.1 alpha/beta hydrolase [Sulfolobus sp. F1]AOL16511.1 carboxylesterase [Sulfolobus sp. A20]